MKPRLSYTIWFSQRTGSTLLSKALTATGIAGKPDERLFVPDGRSLLEHYGCSDYAALREHLWQIGSTPNGVFGLKTSFSEPLISEVLAAFKDLPGVEAGASRPQIWENGFPNCRHIFMTRRNKVRLAVSWWKAIQTEEWHRARGEDRQEVDLSDAYNYKAINQLYCESAMREAGMQAFFSEGGIVPLTIVYEDFIQDFEGTVRRVLAYLGLDADSAVVAAPYFDKLADDVSEAWVQRFREELQQGWQYRGW